MAINWRLKRLLIDREMTQIELTVKTAEALGVKRATVRGVFTGHKTSENIEAFVSSYLGVTREFLFRSLDEHTRQFIREKTICK
jgi:hypothetical protein